MTFDSVNLVLSGIAGSVNTGNHPVVITASDEVNTTTLAFTIVVLPNLGALHYAGSWIPIGFDFGHDGVPYITENFRVHSGFSRHEERQYDADVLGDYYLFFELAVRYLVDPNGHGRSVLDIRDIYLDIRAGQRFTQAFESRMDLSVEEYEANFFTIMLEYLGR